MIVAGAQAVYLRTGPGDLAIAPYTTDGDLAIDPHRLDDRPDLEATMRQAGFELWEPTGTHPEPGIWVAHTRVAGRELEVHIDLIVPAADGLSRSRGARLGPHGKRAARHVPGLEAALVDHGTMTISALEGSDPRSFDIEVAGDAALFVAKAHKLRDRIASARPDRTDDKDAADVYRLMQVTKTEDVAATMTALLVHEIAGPVTAAAIEHLSALFARRGAPGVEMAVRALRVAVPEAQVRTLCTSYLSRLRDGLPT